MTTSPLQNLDTLLDIECADGQQLPYLGYIEVELTVPGDLRKHPCILLVTSDSRYNHDVPLLLGTNILIDILSMVKQDYGERFLQVCRLTTPWYFTLRCLTLQEKELQKNSNRLGIIRSGETSNIIVPPNSYITMTGYLDKELPYQNTPAMLHTSPLARDFKDYDVEPTLIDYHHKQNGPIKVSISNITTRTINIQPKAVICELQPVSYQPNHQQPSEEQASNIIDQMEFTKSDLSEEHFEEGQQLIKSYLDIFSTADDDVGRTDLVKHRIDLNEEKPFKQQYRRIPTTAYDEVRAHLKQLMNAGIIRPSHSPFASNVVLVRKKDNSLRLCVDYRMLNNNTKKDSYSLPRIEELLDCLGGSKFFSVVDMKSGYHQVEIFEPHKERTAFTVGPLGFYEYNRMPFGLTNAPATYQRLMENCLADYHLKICCVFIDDIIVFGKTYEEHLENLRLVMERIRQAHLKLAPKKCSFFKRKVKFVGHIVSEHGVEIDPAKTEKVTTWPKPTSPEDVRRFLGFVGYYRRFIENFSKISRPLTDIMPIPTGKKKTRGKKSTQKREWHWGDEQDRAFNTLKQHLTSTPILAYADSTLPYELHTDASGLGLGAVLYQEQHGKKRVICYASRGLNKSEKNYPPHKLEFLALKWAVTDKLKDYLYGTNFTVLTDNNPMTYVLTTAKLDATGHRWLAALAAYDFNIQYRPGKSNGDADGLSRLPITNDSVRAICQSTYSTPFAECLAVTPDLVKDDDDDLLAGTPTTDTIDWVRAQQQDDTLKHWYTMVSTQHKPTKGDGILRRQFHHLKIVDGVLYRQVQMDDQLKLQLVLPEPHVNTVLQALHDDMGHPGKDRTLSLLRDRFYWPGMTKDVTDWITSCGRCIRRKALPNHRAPLVSIETTAPLQLVCMDYLSLEPSKGGQHSVLVICDHFTRFAQAIPTRNQTARTTAEAFYSNFIIHYGIPDRIHSDQGAQFESKLIKELCILTGMTKSRTTSYHPQGNGMCERFNRTLLNMLGTLEPDGKKNWKAYVGPLVHAYNCTPHESTGFSPFFLMFGRNPRLPVDVVFGLRKEAGGSKYIDNLKKRLDHAFEVAADVSKESQQRQKKGYDTRVRGATIQKGDRVLVKTLAFGEGKHKLADKWEHQPYIVLGQPNEDIPVYTVQRDNGEGRKRNLHRNHLLPIGDLRDRPIPMPRTRKQRPTTVTTPDRPSKAKSPVNHADDESSDEEPLELVIVEPVADDNRDSTIPEDTQLEESMDTAEDIDSDGDAFSHNSGDTVVDGTESVGRRSASTEDTEDEVQEDILDDSTSSSSPEPVRRSTRERKPPDWMRSGAYDLAKSATPPVRDNEWYQKAQFITSLAGTRLLQDLQREAGKTILDILRTPSNQQ